MFGRLPSSVRQALFGNVLMIVFCGFYLAWWLIAFRFDNPVRGLKSGWLLIPAVIEGLAAVVFIVQGITAEKADHALIPNYFFIVIGIAAYIVAAIVTVAVFKRQMTLELFLFIGWGALALAEVNAFFGSGKLAPTASLVMAVLIVFVMLASLVCYVLFYRLDPRSALYDGAIPLILVMVSMAALSVCLVARPGLKQ